MYEILILYLLVKNQSTVYGLAKSIVKFFGYVSNPSFGTIQPAVKRLEKLGCVTSQKFFTDGGKPSFYYSITDKGKSFLEEKLKELPSKNPIQLLPELKVKISCSDVLEEDDRKSLYKILKSELLKLKTQTENILTAGSHDKNFYSKMIVDYSLCEYKNLYELIERLEKHAGNS